ncbi:hypothetical protein DWD10_21215 [Salmonella enterica]|uniref:PepSY domain-containing protein n=1 Tax=Salmonella enterica TaxID=28901 RepID=A0A5T8B9D1_SALER|nr:hypothetical protein [Salmonella enterica]EBN4400471.1 hypothetical protein [Salmonella enterica]
MQHNLIQALTLSAVVLFSPLLYAAPSQHDQMEALHTAEKIYDAMLGDGAAAEANWETPKILKDIKDPVVPGNKLHVIEYTVMDPANGAYQRIHVLVNVDGGVAGAEIIYAGR